MILNGKYGQNGNWCKYNITYDGKIHILKFHDVKFKDQQILSV